MPSKIATAPAFIARGVFDGLTSFGQLEDRISAIGSLEQTEGPVIANGAAAMMAYAALVSGSGYELSLSNELRRYCELDTLGMVFVVEWLTGLL